MKHWVVGHPAGWGYGECISGGDDGEKSGGAMRTVRRLSALCPCE